MIFISYEQLERDVLAWAETLPPHRVVAGVEESGMVPARILARRWRRKAVRLADAAAGDGEGVLVLDDSLNYGGAMQRARRLASGPGFRFASVYVADPRRAAGLVDYHCRVLPHPRVFAWNLWKHDLMAEACVDMDGVLCADYETGQNDDGPLYADFLRRTSPLHLPRVKVAAVVTGRLEKYRPQTAAWLSRHGVRYDHLAMMPFERPEERRAYGIARFKAEIYGSAAYRLFVESDPVQALQIAERTKKPVLLAAPGEEWRLA